MSTTSVSKRDMRNRKGKSGSLYLRLAFTGIWKNGRIYIPYLLTCIGMVMIYYILLFLSRSRHVLAMHGGESLQLMLSLGSSVFSVFAVIFLFYTNSFLIRNRKREFGLYNMLGMGKRHLARVLIWENALAAAVSLGAGLICGLLFSKLAELWIARVLQSGPEMAFEADPGAALQAVILFAFIFGLILLQSLFVVGKSKPIDLLHSTAVGEKPPKGNRFLALAGLALLAGAYFLAVTIEDPLNAFLTFFVAVAMVIVATYLLFITASVVLCRMLQRRKSYYYKANHFISVSSMMYRMKRNGAGLASICVLSTMVLVMLSAVTCLYAGKEDSLHTRYPRQVEMDLYASGGMERMQEDTALLQKTADEAAGAAGAAQKNRLSYRYVGISGVMREDHILTNADLQENFSIQNVADLVQVYLVPLEDYRRMAEEDAALEDGEALVYLSRGQYECEALHIEDYGDWKVKRELKAFPRSGRDSSMVMKSLFVVVPDLSALQAAERLNRELYGENASPVTWYYGFDLDADETVQMRVAEEIGRQKDALRESGAVASAVRVYCRAQQRASFYAMDGGLFVLGILLGMVFLVATVLIMYYKQVSEGYEDSARFDIMRKVGMSRRDIRRSVHSQMLTVFLAPLLVSGLHTAFAFPMVRRLLVLFALLNGKLLLLVMAACFLVFALFYALMYSVTSRAYYRIVSGIQAS